MAFYGGGGFPPATKFEAPDGPVLGPVVDPETGEFRAPRGHTLRNEWACCSGGADGGTCCGGSALRPRPSRPSNGAEYADHGDVGHATLRAAQAANMARGRTPPAVLAAQSCGVPGGACRVNLATIGWSGRTWALPATWRS